MTRNTGDWQQGEARVGEALRGSRVVATVDGHPVTLADVEREGLDGEGPAETLRRLIDLELLAAEAERRGFADDDDVKLHTDRVAARELLARAVAEEVSPTTIDEERYRAAYAAARSRFSQPERRDVEHFLARADATQTAGSKAHSLAQRVLREAQTSPNPHDVFVTVRDDVGDDETARVEDLGVFARDAPLVAPFLDAAFSMSVAGVVPRAVRTEYGWHVIHVREVLPAIEVPFDEARLQLEDEVVLEARRAAAR